MHFFYTNAYAWLLRIYYSTCIRVVKRRAAESMNRQQSMQCAGPRVRPWRRGGEQMLRIHDHVLRTIQHATHEQGTSSQIGYHVSFLD